MQKFKLHSSSVLAAILLLCAVLSSCSKIKEGKITSITFIPPHNELVQKTAYGGNGVSFVTVNEWVPDTTYYITFTNGKKEREICVSRKDAYKYNVGDEIKLTDD